MCYRMCSHTSVCSPVLEDLVKLSCVNTVFAETPFYMYQSCSRSKFFSILFHILSIKVTIRYVVLPFTDLQVNLLQVSSQINSNSIMCQ